MMLKTGADRSGNTSRGSSRIHTAPIATPASASTIATSGFLKLLVMKPASMSVLVLSAAAGLVRLGLQEKRTFDHDLLAGRKPRQHLDLARQIAPAPDRARLELPLPARE